MYTRNMVLIVAVMALLNFAGITSSHAQEMDAETRKQDSRLQRTVTISEARVTLHELLTQLSAQTKVRLSVDTRDVLSGIPLSVHLKNVPLADAMNALWSLLSYRDALLLWKFDPDEKVRRYSLVSTARYRELADRLNSEVQQAFEEQAELMIQMAYMTPEERNRHVAKLSRSMLEKDDKVAAQYLTNSPSAERNWAGIRLFANMLTTEQRRQVWRGQTIYIAFGQLSHDGQEFVRANLPKGKFIQLSGQRSINSRDIADLANSSGEALPPPEPRGMNFFLVRGTEKQERIAPRLMIGIQSSWGGSALSYVGNMDFGLRRRGYTDWMLPGDQKATLFSEKKITGEPARQPTILENAHTEVNPLATILDLSQDNVPFYTRRLHQCAQAVPLSYMAVLPREQPARVEEPFGKTVQEYMSVLTGNPHFLMHKWRGSVLLVNYPNWFYGNDLPVSYRFLEHLRSQARANGGFLPVEAIADAIRTLNAAQIGQLTQEFPVLSEALNWPPMQLCKTFPNILSKQGTPVTPELLASLDGLGQISPEVRTVATRLREENREIRGQFTRVLSLQFQFGSRNWTTVSFMDIKSAQLKTPSNTSSVPKK